MRHSSQREKVVSAYLGIEGHFHLEDLLNECRQLDPSIGLATVYRTIKILKDCGLVQEHFVPGGKIFFEKHYQKAHHDHMICTKCGSLEEFEHPLIEKYQMDVARDHGF